MDADITEDEGNSLEAAHANLASSMDGLFNMPRCCAIRPHSTGTDNSFFRPANIDIIITPCESSIAADYQQAELKTKIARKHGRFSKFLRKKKTLSWLCSFVNERRLRIAATNRDAMEARRLINIDGDMDLNAGDDRKRTALHISAANGADDVVRLLLENGASPNVKDLNGNTPLHLAACSGYIPIVTLLLHYGGNISATDANGKTPLHLVLARQKLFQKSATTETSGQYNHMKRRAQLKDIADLLRECLVNKGAEKDKEEMKVLSERIPTLSSVDEVGMRLCICLGLNFLQGALPHTEEYVCGMHKIFFYPFCF